MERIPETSEGIQGEFDVAAYDLMQRRLRDKGWIETGDVIKSGIDSGHVLEIGPGPGYLGLEWLKKTSGTSLTGVEISPNMIDIATRNALTYGVSERVDYVPGNALDLPFESDSFDAVFTNGSLHEWELPEVVCNEIARVLAPGGRYFISDLRRDMALPIRWFLRVFTKPKEMRAGLLSSLRASYTATELRAILCDTGLSAASVRTSAFGLSASGSAPTG